MNECNSIKNNSLKKIDKIFLSEQTKFQLDEVSKIENYFIKEINQRKSCSQKLNKYVTTFDYIDKTLIVLSATSSGVSIISFTSIAGAPVGIASASFTLIFSQPTGIIKNLLNTTRKMKIVKIKIMMMIIKMNINMKIIKIKMMMIMMK